MDSSKVFEALMASTYNYRKKVALSMEPELPEGFKLSDNQNTVSNDVAATWE